MIVLDTNVVSELMRPTPDSAVAEWVLARDERHLFTTSITLAEIRYGIIRLPDGRRRDALHRTAEEPFASFDGQILPFDTPASAVYASVVHDREKLGLPISGFDAQIAAICRDRGVDLATRNLRDFDHLGLTLVDPWQAGAS